MGRRLWRGDCSSMLGDRGVEATGTDIGFDVASRGRTKLPELLNLVIASLLARFVIYFYSLTSILLCAPAQL